MNEFNKRSAWIVATLLGCLTLVLSPAQAVSFDCGKAASKVEQLICKESAVSTLDDELSIAYQWALMRVDNPQKIVQEQRHWLKEVRNACQDKICLVKVYMERTDELTAQIPIRKCYTLHPIKESGKVRPIEPVCQVLEKNLNQFCDQPPMACGLKIAPEFSNRLSMPTWTALDPQANRALIEEFIRAPWQNVSTVGADERIWQETRDEIEKAFSEKRIGFSESQLDLYNLGKKGTAYRLDYGNCKINNAHFKDRQKWNKLIHPAAVKIQYAPDVVRPLFKQYFPLQHSPFNEVFLFDGKIYEFAMGGSINHSEEQPPANNGLGVNRRETWINPGDEQVFLHLDNICSFNYQPTQGDKK